MLEDEGTEDGTITARAQTSILWMGKKDGPSNLAQS